ncbi:diguanylate cyclase [Chitinimonas lacunae]|uniref:Diguanylate cyclase n=1 Tax=Chitinimonas lacunae TaxID=1963018 RepID=A0ABV8MP24_9NEIS
MPAGLSAPTIAPLPQSGWSRFLRERRIVLALIGLTGLVLLGLISWELRQSYLSARSAAQQAAANLSLLLREQLDGAFRETDLVLRDLAGSVARLEQPIDQRLNPDTRAHLAGLIDDKLATLPQVENLALISGDGEMALNSDGLRQQSFRQRDFFDLLQANPGLEMTFSKPMRLAGGSDLGFVIARRVPDSQGGLAAVVAATVKLEYFDQLARRLDTMPGSVFMLIDNDLRLVGRLPENAAAIGRQIPDSARTAAWVDGRSQGYLVDRSGRGGEARGYSFHRLENYPFIVIVGLPESAYLGNWWRKAGAFAAAGLCLLLLMLATAHRGWREANLALAVAEGQRQVLEQEQQLRLLIDTLSLPMLLVRERGEVIEIANAAAATLFGVEAPKLVGTTLSDYFPWSEHRAEIAHRLHEQRSVTDYELRLKRPEGGSLWTTLSVTSVVYAQEAGYLINLNDITTRKLAQETLWRKATLDPLTGIANRGYFLERAQTEWLRAMRYHHMLGLLMFDLDHFKQINDRYGHAAGDRVLQAFASTISATLRQSDLFGRLGGEEFAAVLPEQNEAGLLDSAERARAAIAALDIVLAEGQIVRVTVSIGAAVLDGRQPDLDSLIKQADLALYAAKRNGRNQVVCYPPLLQESTADAKPHLPGTPD